MEKVGRYAMLQDEKKNNNDKKQHHLFMFLKTSSSKLYAFFYRSVKCQMKPVQCTLNYSSIILLGNIILVILQISMQIKIIQIMTIFLETN